GIRDLIVTGVQTCALPISLRHELAHLALRWHVRRHVPLWFEEGYAAVAAQEWDRLDALRLNWQLARGVHMNLDDVDRALRGAPGDRKSTRLNSSHDQQSYA